MWQTDPSLMSVKDLNKLLYKTKGIENFIQDNSNTYFILANKGMGKTLLLSCKRYSLYKKYGKLDGKRPDVMFIPEDTPYLDNMEELPEVSKDYKQFFANLNNVKRVWRFSLKLSILSHTNHDFDPIEKTEIARVDSLIANWILNRQKQAPTIVFTQLLTAYNPSKLSKMMDSLRPLLNSIINNINHAVYVFVDRLDQGFRNFPQKSWIVAQAGLIEAAWEIMQQNKHFKIFCTSRQEAFFNYQSSNKNAIKGNTFTIKYNKEELFCIIDSLSNHYEKKGFNQVVHKQEVEVPYEEIYENTFDYLYRHSLGRPRDLVTFIGELSLHCSLDDSIFFNTINTACAGVIRNIFDESSALISSLSDETRRSRFFSKITKNILTYDEMKRIVAEYNGFDLQDGDDSFRFINNPFTELYSIGLLGVVKNEDDRYSSLARQYFKQPDDPHDFARQLLPHSEFYFIHPALNSVIKSVGGASLFRRYCHIAVGHHQNWTPADVRLMEIQNCLHELRDLKQKDFDSVIQKIEQFISRMGLFAPINVDIDLWEAWKELKLLLEDQKNKHRAFLEIYSLMEVSIQEIRDQGRRNAA